MIHREGFILVHRDRLRTDHDVLDLWHEWVSMGEGSVSSVRTDLPPVQLLRGHTIEVFLRDFGRCTVKEYLPDCAARHRPELGVVNAKVNATFAGPSQRPFRTEEHERHPLSNASSIFPIRFVVMIMMPS
jgi:hypothetical protein